MATSSMIFHTADCILQPEATSVEMRTPISGAGDTEAPQEDIEPPSKRVKVIAKACEHCKAKKSRCGSSRPQCRTCLRKGVECVYREKGQPGLRPGYGKAVEERLSVLEDNVSRIAQSLEGVLEQLQSRPNFNETAKSTGAPQPTDNSDTLNTGQPIWSPFRDVQVPTPNAFEYQPSVMAPLTPAARASPEPTNGPKLPTEAVLQELSETFFEQIYPWVPILCKENFFSNIFAPERRVLLHGMVVLCSRFWTKLTPSRHELESFVKTSRDHILLTSVDECSTLTTQALTLLAVDTLGGCPGPRTWNILAILIKASQKLNLGNVDDQRASLVTTSETYNEVHLSGIEAEERRRLLWTIYNLDRFASMTYGHPGSINCKTIKAPYPSSDDSWGQAQALEWFRGTTPIKPGSHTHCSKNLWHHYIDILTFVQQSNQFLIQPVDLTLPAQCREWQSNFRRLESALSTWFENLPGHVHEQAHPFDPTWTMIHATFHLINIRIYTVAAFPSTASPYLRPSTSARNRLRESIRSVASLVTSIEEQSLARIGPPFAFIVWVAARSLIILWTTGHETAYGSMPADLQTLLGVLRAMAVWWPDAQRYADLIQLILDTKNDPGGPASLVLFNDTSRTAYGLHAKLGRLADRRSLESIYQTGDFLEMPFLDMVDFTIPQLGGELFGMGTDATWM